MIFRENHLPADDSHEIFLFVIFEKAAKFEIKAKICIINNHILTEINPLCMHVLNSKAHKVPLWK